MKFIFLCLRVMRNFALAGMIPLVFSGAVAAQSSNSTSKPSAI